MGFEVKFLNHYKNGTDFYDGWQIKIKRTFKHLQVMREIRNDVRLFFKRADNGHFWAF